MGYADAVYENRTPLLSAEEVRVSVAGRVLVDGLDLALECGEFVAVLGRNVTGKTMSLMTLAGLRDTAGGHIRLLGRDLVAMPRRDIARSLALLTQDTEDIFPATVMDTVLIGRHPHVGRLRWESAEDHDIARAALDAAGIGDLAERDVLSLSGGERRRLAIAQILTQEPRVYLLDEPTNHLDPQHQLDAMRVFRTAADRGAGVIASLHDANLAARFADRCLLLYGDGRWELGPAGAILDEARLEAVYAVAMDAIDWRGKRLFIAG